MTGKGFGRQSQLLVRHDEIEQYDQRVEREFLQWQHEQQWEDEWQQRAMRPLGNEHLSDSLQDRFMLSLRSPLRKELNSTLLDGFKSFQ